MQYLISYLSKSQQALFVHLLGWVFLEDDLIICDGDLHLHTQLDAVELDMLQRTFPEGYEMLLDVHGKKTQGLEPH